MKRNKVFRIEQRERVIKNRKRLAKMVGVKSKDNADGRYDKKHPLDCGNPRCLTCHHEKVFNIKKRKDKNMDDSEKDQLFDIPDFDTSDYDTRDYSNHDFE